MSKNSSEVIKEKILLANEKFSLFNDKDKVVVGFSGGADSVTLLFSLSEIRKYSRFSRKPYVTRRRSGQR